MDITTEPSGKTWSRHFQAALIWYSKLTSRSFPDKGKMPESVLVFVSPPSLEELEHRLRERGTESGEHLRLRMKNARLEMMKAKIMITL